MKKNITISLMFILILGLGVILVPKESEAKWQLDNFYIGVGVGNGGYYGGMNNGMYNNYGGMYYGGAGMYGSGYGYGYNGYNTAYYNNYLYPQPSAFNHGYYSPYDNYGQPNNNWGGMYNRQLCNRGIYC
ncbi:hypothetical protein IT400_03355 [Candidatus Nomurabacteria bacterium]|nr:hypothetical protein [Candidatus Nomurabacteria bacterium]